MFTASPFIENSVQCASISGKGLHRMVYTEWGEPDNPKVLICAHGLTRTGRDFDILAGALAGHYRVICPDIAGRGKSDWLQNHKDYRFVQYVSDMVTLIARLNVAEVHWLGTSLGGMIGMMLASQTDSPIKRLVVNDIGPQISREGLRNIVTYVGEDISWATLEEAVAYVKAVSLSFGEHSEEQWRFLTEPCVKQRPDGRWQFVYDPGIAPFRSPDAPERNRRMRTMARFFLRFVPENHPSLNMWPMYERIQCPTLVLRGAQSALLSRQSWLKMGETGPKAKLIEIPNVGHAPTFLHTDNIKLVSDFLVG